MKHKPCGGTVSQFVIREHHYCFMRCDKCGAYMGDKTEEEVNKLMSIKVSPTIRRL